MIFGNQFTVVKSFTRFIDHFSIVILEITEKEDFIIVIGLLLSTTDWLKVNLASTNFFDFDTKQDRVLISNNKSNSIQIIDGLSNKEIEKIPIDRPRKLLYDSEEEKLFVISGFAGYGHLRGTGAVVSVIDLATNRIIQQIGQREGFSDMVWHKKLNLIYLAKRNDKKLVVLDCKTFKIIDEIALGKKPDIMAINYNTNKIYLKCCNNYDISVIDISKKMLLNLPTTIGLIVMVFHLIPKRIGYISSNCLLGGMNREEVSPIRYAWFKEIPAQFKISLNQVSINSSLWAIRLTLECSF